MSVLLVIFGACLLVLPVASRLLFLAPRRVGWVMYLANVVLEMIEKRLPIGRRAIEALMVVVASTAIALGFHSLAIGVIVLACHLLLVLQNLLQERRIVNAVQATQETAGLRGSTHAGPRYPGPGLHPALSVTLEGPFVERMPAYDLGVLPSGVPIALDLLIGNHCRVPGQSPVEVSIRVPRGWHIEGDASATLPPIRSGEVRRVSWLLRAAADDGQEPLRIVVRSSRFERTLDIRHLGARALRPGDIASAEIARYPGARRAAFSLRGDMDLYDTSSLQSIDGLEQAFGLSARFAMAQTMYLSTRLSLDQKEATEWANHHSVDRGAAEIPDFIAWMRESVELRHSAPYPVVSSKRFVIELGNHGHLHYDTDTSGAPGNGWKAGARPGEGTYPWQGSDHTSLGDQRDNICEAARWCERLFGFEPRSWAKPGRGNDAFSPAAVEAAGCAVATGSDIRPRDNVLRQPPPHHPSGTRIVEITARYPSDPQHVQHLAMLEFWLHRGHRLGVPVIVLVHQHMRQFDGVVCARLTEALLSRVIDGFHGDLLVETVHGVGRYWLDVLSPVTRVVEVTVAAEGVRVTNRGSRSIEQVPLDLRLQDGRRATRLLDLPAGETIVVTA